jgi:hypothetical protein
MYPNPFLAVLNVESQEAQVQILIRNLNGQIINKLEIQAGKYQIDASEWASGLYIIEVLGTTTAESFKFIKS